MTKLTPLIALTAFACCSAASAHDSVSFRDLDVNTLQGVQVLFQRISDAASRVCSDPRLDLLPDSRPQYVQCVDNAMAGAIATIDRPTLTALAAKHGIHPTTGTTS